MGGPFPCWLSIVSPGRSKVGRVAWGVLEESFSGCEVSPAAVPLEFEAAVWPLAVVEAWPSTVEPPPGKLALVPEAGPAAACDVEPGTGFAFAAAAGAASLPGASLLPAFVASASLVAGSGSNAALSFRNGSNSLS